MTPYGYVNLTDSGGTINAHQKNISDIPVYSKKQVEMFLEKILFSSAEVHTTENYRYAKIRAMIDKFKQS